jgi:hypothetical protein
LARFAALGAGASVAATLLFDFHRGVGNLVRADVLALVGLYFLTLFEFLSFSSLSRNSTSSPTRRARAAQSSFASGDTRRSS